ncbi:MAG: efflux RND transporter periplasmic adaptor subunit [Magnetospirillum sp. WYHS-4]
MKRSYVTAALMAVAAVGWIASGHLGGGSPANGKTHPEPGPEAAERPLATVRVRDLTAQERPGELLLFGRTEAERRVEVKAETAGRVAEVVARKGGPVTKGDVIVRLAMDDRRARLAEAEARVEQARMSHDAGRQLAEKSFRSQVTVADEKAKLETAKAAAESARLDIERTAIRAPFDGQLDELPVEVGDYLDVGGVAGRIIDLDPILVAAEVAERDVGRLQPGAIAHARLIDGRPVEGVIRYLSKAGTKATRTFRVEVAVPNPDGAIAEGLTVELRLDTGRAKAHRIPRSVLTLADNGVLGVKTVDGEGRVVFHAVNLVADAADGLWVGGLPERAMLITVGQEFVRPGQAVTAVPDPETP